MEGILEPPSNSSDYEQLPRGTVPRDEPPPPTFPIRALVTDIENILVDERPWEQWLVTQLQAAGFDVEHVLSRWHRSELLRCANAGLIPIWDAWHDFLMTVGTSVGWTEELVIGIRYRYENAFAHCRLHPDLVSAFREFQHRNIRLAILADSHWRQDELDQVLHQLRIPAEISYATTTALLGASGPDPKPFTDVMRQLAIPPHLAAFLGWNRRSLEAAHRAELISVRFNGTSPTEADIDLHDTHELVQRLVPAEDPDLQRAA